jgi:hypothetical protein
MGNDNKRTDGSVAEEASAFGERVKGAVKDGAGCARPRILIRSTSSTVGRVIQNMIEILGSRL